MPTTRELSSGAEEHERKRMLTSDRRSACFIVTILA